GVFFVDGGSRRRAHCLKSPQFRKLAAYPVKMSNIRSVELGFSMIASAPETSVDADWAFVIQSRSPFCPRQP
ncbi:MAG: hypothetical protein ACN6PY_06115, partial [Paraburkholderia nemoris]